MIELRTGDALLAVDLQNDFLPGGALGVAHGDAVIAPLNACMARFRGRGLRVFASRDWHPAGHCSFAEQGGPWPVHCVAGTPGAAFAAGFALPPDVPAVSKATTRGADAYSAFAGTDLADLLAAARVRRLFVGGLATDYCVLNTVLDARRLGFDVVVIEDAIRAVDAHPGDGERALAAMKAAGASFAPAAEIDG